MNTLFSKVDDLRKTVRQIFDDRIAALKSEVAERAATILSNITATIIVAVILFSSFIVFSIGFAFLLGRWTGQQFYGFAIVALLHLLIGVIIWKMRDSILKAPILRSFREQLFEKRKDERSQ